MRYCTSRKGLKGIEEIGIYNAGDNNRVYSELAKDKPLSKAAIMGKYQISDNKARDYLETDVPEELL